MDLGKLFQRREQLTSIDIGASSVKIVELELGGNQPTLQNLCSMPVAGEVFSSNLIAKTDKVADVISELIDTNGIDDKRVVTSVPGPAVFTKRIKTQKMAYADLVTNVQFEASNFIPHSIDAVKLDFHILREVGKNQLELLVVAVKNEIIDALIDTLSMAGLEAAIIDIDYFALQNVYEFSYPEHVDSTVALVDFGARYSSVNIIHQGQSLFTGDVSAGSRTVVDNLQESLEISEDEAEKLVRGETDDELAKRGLEAQVESLAKEFNRQLSFFWSATGAEQGIDRIVLSGGATRLKGFLESLNEVTGLPCDFLDPFRNIEVGEDFDQKFVSDMAPSVAVACGMALREPGDRILPEDL